MGERKGFAYSFWDNGYGVREGIVLPIKADPKLSFFMVDVSACGVVASEPGIMANDIVWFEERNDHEARRLLMENEHQIIHRLEEKLKEHHGKLKTLVIMVEDSLKEV